ncbi:MAG: DNA adenine methylase [Candidatus Humimicrobiaceae bacterium]
MKTTKITAKPFVKWAGGKGQLLANIQRKYPSELGKNINRYCEPFVGGGAVFFDILSRFDLQEILINDVNVELINTYWQIQNHVEDFLNQLQTLQDNFLPLDSQERKTYYYEKRERFNNLKVHGNKQINLEKAVLFIFLNKTCFNGLFRVNRQGLFNVPMGAYKKPNICDEKNLISISKLIKNVTIQCGDYKDCLPFINENTFVYIDPPYRPITETSSFTTYSENRFDDIEQIALGKFIDAIHNIGVKVIISNSDPKNSDENDEFFDELYKAYYIQRVTAKRMINCNGESRGNISELLVSNY